MLLLNIIAACLVATVLAIAVAYWLHGKVLSRVGDSLACVSTGLLLTLACTHLIPEAFEQGEPHALGVTLWAACFAMLFLEQFFGLHQHGGHGAGIAMRGVWPIVVGDALHTATDGIVIASSFLVSPSLGWAVTAGILLHEFPQEVGDFVLLTVSGVSEKRAFRLLMIAGASAAAGGILGYFVMEKMTSLLPYALMLSAASFLYISMCELIPRLSASVEGKGAFLRQAMLLLLGAAIAFVIGIEH